MCSWHKLYAGFVPYLYAALSRSSGPTTCVLCVRFLRNRPGVVHKRAKQASMGAGFGAAMEGWRVRQGRGARQWSRLTISLLAAAPCRDRSPAGRNVVASLVENVEKTLRKKILINCTFKEIAQFIFSKNVVELKQFFDYLVMPCRLWF